MPPAPANGSLSCRVRDDNQYVCKIDCLPGLKLLQGVVDEYTCDLDTAEWSPKLPDGITCSDAVEPTVGLRIPNTPPLGQEGQADGYCYTYGQTHYRTFDGLTYDFHGACSYLFAGDCLGDSFKIHVHNQNRCRDQSYCRRSISLFVGGVEYRFDRGPDGAMMWKESKNIAIPKTIDGMRVEKVSDYLIISASLGFTLMWNADEAVFVHVVDDLVNKTCGLCGKFNGFAGDDLTDLQGNVASTVASFASSFKMNDIDDQCSDDTQYAYCYLYSDKADIATVKCDAIKGDSFSACHSVIDPNPFYEACREDVCSGIDECQSYEAYARECARHGVDNIEWRSDDRCPVSCPAGMVYKQCGSSCPRTCSSGVYQCLHDNCVDGCQCPDGMIMHNDACIPNDQCPCVWSKREYSTGSQITADDGCNTCLCEGGKWSCTSSICSGTCSISGGIHYKTFDGRRYDFLGECTYILLTHRNAGLSFFSINIEYHHCNDPNDIGNGFQPCSRSLIVTNGDTYVKLKRDQVILVHGDELEPADLPYSAPGIFIEQVTSQFQKVTLDSGVEVLWNGEAQVYIQVPPTLFNQTCGLCGTYDHNQENDFWTLEGDIERQTKPFCEKWKFASSCTSVPPVTPENPCEIYSQRREQSTNICHRLRQPPFSDCHSTVNVDDYYDTCKYDLCNDYEHRMEDKFCEVASSYAMECANRGNVILWRDSNPKCAVTCSNDQIYQECGSACQTSCPALDADRPCEERCVQGCSCPPGMVTDFDGRCVQISDCHCKHNDRLYPAGTQIQPICQPCTCTDGAWDCLDVECDPPICGENMRYSKCKESCRKTCANMHLSHECEPVACEAGCECIDGFVFDGDQCISPEQCPCHHGDKSYTTGDVISVECNNCVCNGSHWECEMRDCPGICSAWGDSHTKTFDGRLYEYFGECTYVFSKSTADNPYLQYRVTTENIPCSSNGITCSKTITFTVTRAQGDETVKLQKGSEVEVSEGSRFEVWQTGMFTFVKVKEGITIVWDKGTRVYLKLDPKFKGYVEGLCGNFNSNQMDDFIMSLGGPPATNAIEFSDSWKLYSHCGETHNTQDSCSFVPHRRAWATKQCCILKSDIFKPCHAEVDYTPFYDNCVFDSCACDSGGDCECLCTALAAYAQECNMHGVSVRWRSQELCPMQCEGCGDYQPCVSACPRTCDNYFDYDPDGCNEPCVEGCHCPADEVYDPDTNSCVPESACYCIKIDGVKYYDGQVISSCSDACRTCYCFNHTIHYVGVHCLTTPFPTSTAIVTTREPEETTKPPVTTQIFSSTAAITTKRQTTEQVTTHIPTTAAANNNKESHNCSTNYRATDNRCSNYRETVNRCPNYGETDYCCPNYRETVYCCSNYGETVNCSSNYGETVNCSSNYRETVNCCPNYRETVNCCPNYRETVNCSSNYRETVNCCSNYRETVNCCPNYGETVNCCPNYRETVNCSSNYRETVNCCPNYRETVNCCPNYRETVNCSSNYGETVNCSSNYGETVNCSSNYGETVNCCPNYRETVNCCPNYRETDY
ncbi:von Willebrand factor-like [Ptychodera flava]|uniref:von Willebrand factor-like n=1 Tax=Ptychodera flava TaxID=63121 RepID=UPI00396A675C